MSKIWYHFVLRSLPGKYSPIDINAAGVGIILAGLELSLKLCYHSVGKLTQFVHQMSVFLEALSDFRSVIRNDFGMHLSYVMMDYQTNNAGIIFGTRKFSQKAQDAHLYSFLRPRLMCIELFMLVSGLDTAWKDLGKESIIEAEPERCHVEFFHHEIPKNLYLRVFSCDF